MVNKYSMWPKLKPLHWQCAVTGSTVQTVTTPSLSNVGIKPAPSTLHPQSLPPNADRGSHFKRNNKLDKVPRVGSRPSLAPTFDYLTFTLKL